ncbi:MAG TPA: hypothetical protein VH234_03040 [Candidatus Saccharimonadales bacterium]|jgi:hypothetical protein|nr:hypothetical protein [Candidatus Saccharimonadales bacterium]
MKKRYLIIGALLVFIFVLVAIFTRPPKPKQVAIYKASSTASNIQFPYLASSKTIDFFTGSGFAAYDTSAGTTTTLSPQFILPSVSSMSWSSSGAVFQASGYTPADDLYQVLLNDNQPLNQSYWWSYSLSSQKISLILLSGSSKTIGDALENSSGANYAYLCNDGSVYLSDSPGRAIVKVSPSSKIVQLSGNTLTIEGGNSLEQVDTQTAVTKVLVNGRAQIQNAYVSADSQTIAYTASTNQGSKGETPGSLYLLNPASHRSHKILSGFEGFMSGGGGNLYVGYSDNNSVVHFEYYPLKGQSLAYSIGTILDRDATLSNILPLNTNNIFVDSSRNTLVKASTRPSNTLNPINNSYLIAGDFYFDGFEIHFNPSQNTYEIDITKNPFSQYQANALAYISSQKIDPNQIIINWRAGDGVTNINPGVVGSSPQATTNSPNE